MIVRPLRRKDLPAVSRLAAQLIRQHHNLDGERFFEVEDPEEGYRWFFSKEMEREKAIILVAEEGGRKADGRAGDEAGGGKIVGYVYATLEARNWNDLLDACGKINDILVAFGQRLCRPISPHCSRCPIVAYCPRRGVTSTR